MPALARPQRQQLTVSLGDGPEGFRLRVVLSDAAARAGHPSLSAWVREVLMRESGHPLPALPPDRREFDELARRVRALECWRFVAEPDGK